MFYAKPVEICMSNKNLSHTYEPFISILSIVEKYKVTVLIHLTTTTTSKHSNHLIWHFFQVLHAEKLNKINPD